MKWFDKWFFKKWRNAQEEYNNSPVEPAERNWAVGTSGIKRARQSNTIGDTLDSPSVRFKMFKASGGTIIETTIYNERNDQHIHGLYVLSNDKDLGAEISKILTMESLKV